MLELARKLEANDRVAGPSGWTRNTSEENSFAQQSFWHLNRLLSWLSSRASTHRKEYARHILLLIIITTRIKILKHPLYAYETSLLTMRWALTMSRTAAHRTTKLKSRKSRLIWKVYHNANNDLLSCCIKAVAEKDTIRSEHPVNKTNIYMEKYLQCLVLANGYPHCAQRLFWMWKELRPHRRQRVWVLFLRLPKLVVPLVYNKKLTN